MDAEQQKLLNGNPIAAAKHRDSATLGSLPTGSANANAGDSRSHSGHAPNKHSCITTTLRGWGGIAVLALLFLASLVYVALGSSYVEPRAFGAAHSAGPVVAHANIGGAPRKEQKVASC